MSRRLRADDDRSLAAAAAHGDRDAAEELLRRHHDMVVSVCRRIVIDRGGADDAAQEALVSVARGLASYDGRAAVRTWMYRIAVNAALDEIRRAKRRPPVADPAALDSRALTSGPDGAAADRDELHRALVVVPEEFRTALALRYLMDMEYAEIARVLDVPIGTVRSRISRGRDVLRAALSGNPERAGRRQTQHRGRDPDPRGS